MLQTLMGILSTLVTIAKYLPDALKLGYQVWDFIRDSFSKYEQEQKIEALKKAIEKAKTEKDTSNLEDMFGKKVKTSASLDEMLTKTKDNQ